MIPAIRRFSSWYTERLRPKRIIYVQRQDASSV
jgi:hypothetical protein